MKRISFFALYLCSFSALAFTLSNSNRVSLPDPKVKLVIASNTCSAAGFNSAQELADMVTESVNEYWNRVPTCALEMEVEGVSSGIDTTSDTLNEAIQKVEIGKILLGCSDNATLFSSAGILGVGSINTVNGDRGVLLLNNRDTTFANQTQQEKLAIIAHELGHAFGLGHSGDPTALMYYAVGGKVQEKLTIDDYDGCSYLYPHDSPGSCSAIPVVPFGKGPFVSSGGKGSAKEGSSNGTSNLFFLFIAGLFLTMTAGFVSRRKTW
ncbi:MAG: matrixin family metalloprotease [Halobacteriovoraceae bacterium]|nr:matrixin family metalloprotease [Halobacteriovoraceae bacterium]